MAVEKQDPLKQGLKLTHKNHIQQETRVEKQDPLKQGLKQMCGFMNGK